MRLREVERVLRENLPKLKLRMETGKTHGGAPGHVMHNMTEIREAIRALAEVPGFVGELEGLQNDALLKVLDGATVEQTATSNLQQRLDSVRRGGGRLLDVLSNALPSQDPLTISVKLPPESSLTQLRADIDRLVQVLDVAARHVTGEGVRFSNFDTGSNWIELVAVLEVVYWFVVGLLRATQTYRQNELKLLLAQEHLRGVQTTNEYLDGLRLHVDEHLKLQRQTLAEAIVAEHAAPKEAVGQVMLAIENLSEMYAQGAEVHRAMLNAPVPRIDENDPNAKPPPAFPEHSALPTSLIGPSRQLGTGSADADPTKDDVPPS